MILSGIEVSKLKIKVITFTLLTLTFNFALLTFNLDGAEASALSLGIYPPIIQIETTPPSDIKVPITLKNLGEEPLELNVQFLPFIAKKENGEVFYIKTKEFEGPDPFIFKKMQIFDNGHNVDTILLSPNQEKNLTFHIGLPKDEPLSDYYFSITFLQNQELIKGLNITQAAGGISTNVLLSIGPKGKTKGSIEEFSVPVFFEKGPVPFTVRVKNSSDHYIIPKGQILIRNMFGQNIGKVDLLPVNILANSIRAIPDSLQLPEATRSSTFNFELLTFNSPKAFWNESFLLGPYTAILTLSLSDQGPASPLGGPIFTKTVYFIGFPLQLVLGLIIAIIIIVLIRDKLNRRKLPM